MVNRKGFLGAFVALKKTLAAFSPEMSVDKVKSNLFLNKFYANDCSEMLQTCQVMTIQYYGICKL